MTYIDKIAKFSKTFFKAGAFSAKHVVDITNYAISGGSDTNSKRGPLYIYDVSDRSTREIKKGVTLSSRDNIILSNNNKNTFNISGEASGESFSSLKSSAFVYIDPKDFDKVKESLNSCISWLCDQEYEKLFTLDASGNTVGVSKNDEVSISRFKNGWIMFKPAVIFDVNGAGYQGIYLKCDRGILGSLTGTEFKEFSNYMFELMNNFYQCSLSLYTAGLMSTLLNKS